MLNRYIYIRSDPEKKIGNSNTKKGQKIPPAYMSYNNAHFVGKETSHLQLLLLQCKAKDHTFAQGSVRELQF